MIKASEPFENRCLDMLQEATNQMDNYLIAQTIQVSKCTMLSDYPNQIIRQSLTHLYPFFVLYSLPSKLDHNFHCEHFVFALEMALRLVHSALKAQPLQVLRISSF